MTTKHTPGPWRIEGRNVMTPHGMLSVSGVSQPCGYVPEDDVSHANARLIAASPCLLQFVEAYQAAPYMDHVAFKERFGFSKSDMLTKSGELIAKATGEAR